MTRRHFFAHELIKSDFDSEHSTPIIGAFRVVNVRFCLLQMAREEKMDDVYVFVKLAARFLVNLIYFCSLWTDSDSWLLSAN